MSFFDERQPLSSAFNRQVLNQYEAARAGTLFLSHRATEVAESGHPEFAGLDVGQQRTVEIASLFLDLTNFTGRTFWDPSDQVADLADAVLSGFTLVVKRLGGHVLGLRGDGLFAGFGPVVDSRSAIAAAAAAGALSLLLVEQSLNPALVERGIEPVQARAGADFGPATFVRTGTETTNEVNVIGFASNFAAKCEKAAKSWEMVVGERFASDIEDGSLLTRHENSPKVYQRDYEVKRYHFYRYSWRPVARIAETAAVELHGRALEQVY